MKGLPGTKKNKQPLFQVLLLDNTADLDVEVHESRQVDFFTVKEHLKNGGSVFITSKKQQKLTYPKAGNAQQKYIASRKNYGALVQETYEKQHIV
jgi:hypothetical protein